MSRFSERRLFHLARLILNRLRKDNLVDAKNEGRALTETKSVLADFLSREERVDDLVRKKIASLSRPVPQGSREWDILYRKFFEEETRKQKI
jgi:hypothetical protein